MKCDGRASFEESRLYDTTRTFVFVDMAAATKNDDGGKLLQPREERSREIGENDR